MRAVDERQGAIGDHDSGRRGRNRGQRGDRRRRARGDRARPTARPAAVRSSSGPNSLGAISRPGGYDTLFIPQSRLDKRWSAPGRRVALVSQSGAFIVSRMSNLEMLDPKIADLARQSARPHSRRRACGPSPARDDIDAIGVYVEGLQRSRRPGAAAGHRARDRRRQARRVLQGRPHGLRAAAPPRGTPRPSPATTTCARRPRRRPGALVAETFKEFEQMLELCTALHDKPVRGVRIGAVSNAGFEMRRHRRRDPRPAIPRADRGTVGGVRARRWRRCMTTRRPLAGSSTRATRSTSRRWPTRRPTRARSA